MLNFVPVIAPGFRVACAQRTWQRAAPGATYRKRHLCTGFRLTSCTGSSTSEPKSATSPLSAVGVGGAKSPATESKYQEGWAPSIIADNESEYYATRLVVSCKDRQGLLADLTEALQSLGLQVRRAVARTKNGIAVDEFHVTRGGSQLSETELEEVRNALLPAMGAPGPSCPIEGESERRLPAPRSPVRFVDHNRGVHVYVDNHASPHYTTITVNAPDRPNLINDIVDVLRDLELNVTFASMSTFANQDKYRHDIFHVTTMTGEQVDAAEREEIMNTLYFMLTTKDTDEQSF
jgi:UTP:GlnB (protein PII) uridylyltransferase